jgi:DDE superfamily endonuclease
MSLRRIGTLRGFPAKPIDRVGTRVRNAGAKLFVLPKYSPDLNPIEQVFAKLKHLLQSNSPHPNRRLPRHRPAPRQLHGRGMHKLPPQLSYDRKQCYLGLD